MRSVLAAKPWLLHLAQTPLFYMAWWRLLSCNIHGCEDCTISPPSHLYRHTSFLRLEIAMSDTTVKVILLLILEEMFVRAVAMSDWLQRCLKDQALRYMNILRSSSSFWTCPCPLHSSLSIRTAGSDQWCCFSKQRMHKSSAWYRNSDIISFDDYRYRYERSHTIARWTYCYRVERREQHSKKKYEWCGLKGCFGAAKDQSH